MNNSQGTFIGLPATQQAISNYRYSGFSISTIYEEFLRIVTTNNLSDDKIAEDLTYMLGLYFVRGPNTGKMDSDNTIGSDSSYTEIQNLIKRYDLKLNKSGAKTITLVRLVMVFPVPAYNVYKSIKPEYLNHPITEAEIGLSKSQLFSLPFTPCFLSHSDLFKDGTSAMILLVYNIYQSHLSYRTRQNFVENKFIYSTKDPLDNFNESTKYSLLASHGSLSKTQAKSMFLQDNQSIIEDIEKNILEAFEVFCRRVPSGPTLQMPTRYHILHNISWKRNILVKDLECKTDSCEVGWCLITLKT